MTDYTFYIAGAWGIAAAVLGGLALQTFCAWRRAKK